MTDLQQLPVRPDVLGPSDGVEVSIFGARVRNVAWTVGRTVICSARSTLIQQGDLAAGVLDAAGRVIALDEHLPLMAYSLAPGVQSILHFFGSDIQPGDVFLQNDVWYGNIQHADVGVFAPVFHGGTPAAWVACRGHWADIGGAVAGTANPDAVEVWQEALRIPPVRIATAAGRCRDVWNLVFENVRMRERVESDAEAQLGACVLGVDAMQALIRRTGGRTAFDAMVTGLFKSSEQVLQRALQRLPRGTFQGECDFIDESSDGVTAYPVRVSVTVESARVVVDFAGSAQKALSFMNAPLGATTAASLVTILTLLGPGVEHNHGVLSRFHVAAPEGGMLNAAFPSATFGGNKLCEYIGSAIMNAFAEVLPESVCAEWSRRLSLRVSGRDPRNSRRYHEIFFLTYSGGGAAFGADGYNQPGLMSGGNVVHQDYELMELQAPLIVWKHEYAPGSAGDGRWRGGLGNETIVEHYGEDVVFVTHGGGTTQGAQGILGGTAASANLLEVTDASGKTHRMRAREKLGPFAPPVTTRQLTGGGGGYGAPALRDPHARRRDAEQGLV